MSDAIGVSSFHRHSASARLFEPTFQVAALTRLALSRSIRSIGNGYEDGTSRHVYRTE